MKNMKKSIAVLSALALTLSISATALAADNQARGIVIDGQKVADTSQMQNDQLLLPLRGIGEASGYKIGWSAPNHQITLTKDGKNITISLDDQTYTINDHKDFLRGQIQMINERTYMSSDLVKALMGFKVTSSQDNQLVELTTQKQNTITIRNVKDNAKSDQLTFDIQYPQIAGLADAKVQEQINKTFEQYATAIKDQALKDQKDHAATEADDAYKTEVAINYDIKYNQDNVLSVVFDHYYYTGGAHGNTVQSSYNFDLQTGKDLKLKDLYSEGKDFTSLINQAIKKQMDVQKQTESLLTPFESIAADQPFYIADNNQLVIYFQQYEYFPYAMGMPEYSVAFDGFPAQAK